MNKHKPQKGIKAFHRAIMRCAKGKATPKEVRAIVKETPLVNSGTVKLFQQALNPNFDRKLLFYLAKIHFLLDCCEFCDYSQDLEFAEMLLEALEIARTLKAHTPLEKELLVATRSDVLAMRNYGFEDSSIKAWRKRKDAKLDIKVVGGYLRKYKYLESTASGMATMELIKYNIPLICDKQKRNLLFIRQYVEVWSKVWSKNEKNLSKLRALLLECREEYAFVKATYKDWYKKPVAPKEQWMGALKDTLSKGVENRT